MVCIIHDCCCDHCPGSTPAKPNKHSKPGELIFGGTICRCECHKYSVKKRKLFLDIKYGRIPTARALRDKFNSDLDTMQNSCKHSLISDWLPTIWVREKAKKCLICDKIVRTK